ERVGGLDRPAVLADVHPAGHDPRRTAGHRLLRALDGALRTVGRAAVRPGVLPPLVPVLRGDPAGARDRDDPAPRRRRQGLRAAVVAVTVGGSAIGFALTVGRHHPTPSLGPPPAATPGDHPVLIAAGLHSHYDPHSPLDLPRGYVGWRFSYRGLGSLGRPLP